MPDPAPARGDPYAAVTLGGGEGRAHRCAGGAGGPARHRRLPPHRAWCARCRTTNACSCSSIWLAEAERAEWSLGTCRRRRVEPACSRSSMA